MVETGMTCRPAYCCDCYWYLSWCATSFRWARTVCDTAQWLWWWKWCVWVWWLETRQQSTCHYDIYVLINTFRLCRVLVLCHFHKLEKKCIGGTGFRFVPLDSPMLVVSVTVQIPSRHMCVRMLTVTRERLRNTVWTFDSMNAFVLSQLTHAFKRSKSLCLSQQCAGLKPAAVLDYKYNVERSDQMLSHYYTLFQRHILSWQEKLSTCFPSVQRRMRQTGKAVKTYYNVLLKMLCRTLRWAVFWIELHKNGLLEIKVTWIFRGSAAKTLFQRSV
jgi:hypothetical protein